jgi:hypothetical protein
LPTLPTVRDGILLGVSVALAILAKPQGMAMVPTTLVVIAVVLWKRLRDRRVLWFAGAVLGSLLLVRLFPTVWTYFNPDPPASPTAQVVVAASKNKGWPSLLGFVDFVDHLAESYRTYLFRSAWGQFSWLEFTFADHWFDEVHRAITLCMLGLLAAGVTRVLVPAERKLWWSVVPVLFAALSALTGTLFILFAEYYSRHLGMAWLIQGRSFLLALPPFAVLAVIGLGSLVPARFRTLAATGIVVGMIGINLGALVCVAGHHYGG